jgi:hypothetical protein
LVTQARNRVFPKTEKAYDVYKVMKDFVKNEGVDESVTALIKERKIARKNKDWADSDRIRDELLAQGIVLKDNQVVYQEKLLEELKSRVRDVRVGNDGYLYVAVENPGRIIKISPK